MPCRRPASNHEKYSSLTAAVPSRQRPGTIVPFSLKRPPFVHLPTQYIASCIICQIRTNFAFYFYAIHPFSDGSFVHNHSPSWPETKNRPHPKKDCGRMELSRRAISSSLWRFPGWHEAPSNYEKSLTVCGLVWRTSEPRASKSAVRRQPRTAFPQSSDRIIPPIKAGNSISQNYPGCAI